MTAGDDPRRVLYAQFEAVRGSEEKVAALVREYGDVVRAEAGNLVFSAHRKREHPAEFFVYEEYADSEAFAMHIHAPYGIDFNAALTQLIVGDGSQLTFLQPL